MIASFPKNPEKTRYHNSQNLRLKDTWQVVWPVRFHAGKSGVMRRRRVLLNNETPVFIHVVFYLLLCSHVIFPLLWVFLHEKTSVRIHVVFCLMVMVLLLLSLLVRRSVLLCPCAVCALLDLGWLSIGMASTFCGWLLLVEGNGDGGGDDGLV